MNINYYDRAIDKAFEISLEQGLKQGVDFICQWTSGDFDQLAENFSIEDDELDFLIPAPDELEEILNSSKRAIVMGPFFKELNISNVTKSYIHMRSGKYTGSSKGQSALRASETNEQFFFNNLDEAMEVYCKGFDKKKGVWHLPFPTTEKENCVSERVRLNVGISSILNFLSPVGGVSLYNKSCWDPSVQESGIHRILDFAIPNKATIAEAMLGLKAIIPVSDQSIFGFRSLFSVVHGLIQLHKSLREVGKINSWGEFIFGQVSLAVPYLDLTYIPFRAHNSKELIVSMEMAGFPIMSKMVKETKAVKKSPIERFAQEAPKQGQTEGFSSVFTVPHKKTLH